MAITNKYGFETISYGNTGWNGLLSTFIAKVDAYLWSRMYEQLGEAVSEGHVVYFTSDGKLLKAQADGTKQPMIGIAIEEGILNDYIRIQRAGKITVSTWNWTRGGRVWLSQDTAGVLTQTEPTTGHIQLVGLATAATTILLTGNLITSYIAP